MAFADVMGNVQRMTAGMDALAAIGAQLGLGADSDNTDPAYLAALGAVADAAGVDLSSLEPPQRAMVLGLIRLSFRQADDQLNDPDRPLGWTHTDPTVLEGMGRMSMMIPTLLAGAPEFASLTSFLDVGTGVGLLAVSAASVWPKATIVGIDVWEPSLERARKNVSEAGLADRITLRNQDLAALDDTATYDGRVGADVLHPRSRVDQFGHEDRRCPSSGRLGGARALQEAAGTVAARNGRAPKHPRWRCQP